MCPAKWIVVLAAAFGASAAFAGEYVASWDFDETVAQEPNNQPGVDVDHSGNGHRLTYAGDGFGSIPNQYVVPGRSGNGWLFSSHIDGLGNPDSFVSSSPLPAAAAKEGVTVEAWINPSAYPASSKYATIVSLNGAWRLSMDWLGGVFFEISLGAKSSEISTETLTFPSAGLQLVPFIPLNQWTHVAGSWDGVTVRAYVNGVRVASAPAVGMINVPAYPYVYVGITGISQAGGAQGYFNPSGFDGVIDEVRISRGSADPRGCPSRMIRSQGGFCIDQTPVTENQYLGALDGCAQRLTLVCTYSQIRTSAYYGEISMPQGGPWPRTADVMFNPADNFSYFGGTPGVAGATGQLTNTPINVGGSQLGPEPVATVNGQTVGLAPYYCCRN